MMKVNKKRKESEVIYDVHAIKAEGGAAV
jgi:hypothetical protein